MSAVVSNHPEKTVPVLLVLACLLLPFAAPAAPGDELAVTAQLVNVRRNPSLDSPVILKFARGRAVTEVRRADDWVEVDTGREDEPRGWIHASLLEPVDAPAADATNGEGTGGGIEAVFDLFKQALAEYNARKNKATGYAYFIQPEYTGHGVVVVTGTRPWLQQPMQQRMKDLDDLFRIWAAAVGEGPSITVNVVDGAGDKQMTMYR